MFCCSAPMHSPWIVGLVGGSHSIKMPLHVRLARELYPKAQLAQFPDSEEVVSLVSTAQALAPAAFWRDG